MIALANTQQMDDVNNTLICQAINFSKNKVYLSRRYRVAAFYIAVEESNEIRCPKCVVVQRNLSRDVNRTVKNKNKLSGIW